ncbi:MAG: insulinase family protein, partial [Chlamydiales bacterium]|nr:insulinase family protein [Chlamydiales bacterium]
MSNPSFTSGTRYQGFLVTKSQEIPELQCHLTELIHEATGAQFLHLGNDDPENLFCLSFQTLPENSNGVAHILEHTVLCGSKKYPVKDPFFSMNRRSLNTFMNALTGADFTCYPAASQVEQDFYNLLEVYLDAVFHPLIKELSFLQEGCRVELSNPDDLNSPLEYKGVVYNEMKGALSSSTTRLIEHVNAALYPDSPYGFNSGGEPSEIPSLTYEKLKEFHKNYYHPSRCLFFFYGNLPLQKHLDFVAQRALKDVVKLDPLPPIPKQPRFSKPVYKEAYYPVAADDIAEDKAIISFAWLTCSILDQQTLLALSILDIVLMETDASILKIELLRSGLCKQAQSLMDTEIAEIPYGVILKGCRAKDVDALEKVLFDTLNRLARDGIPNKLIENALHQVEMYRSEITGDSAPYGLSLFSRSALLSQHGGKAIDGLLIHSIFDEFRATLASKPTYMNELIARYFLANNHFVRVVMHPSTELAGQEAAQEAKSLQELAKTLTLVDRQKILAQTLALEELQEEEEEDEIINILPKIALEKIPKQVRSIPLTHIQENSLEIYHHNTFTNKITYADLVFSVPEIKADDLWLVRLFSVLLPQIGNGNRSYEDTLEYIQENTGGIGAFTMLNHQVQEGSNFIPSFHIRGKSMYHKADKFFGLLFDMATNPNFTDRSRLKELVLKHYTNLQSSLVSQSLKYAMNLAAQNINVSGYINNAWYGLDYVYKIKALAEDFDNQSDWLIQKLEEMQKLLLCTRGPNLVLGCDQTELTKYIENGFGGLQDLPQTAYTPWKNNYHLASTENQGRVIASQVAFTSTISKTISYSHPDAAAISLAAFLFDNITLHKRVREQGGAYGAGAIANIMSGTFAFYSYRDPNIAATLDAFKESLQMIAKHEFDDADLEEAKREMIQSLDSPIAPGTRAEVAYGWLREGKTLEMRQAFRDACLHATCTDIVRAVEQHLV